ncbi:MAG: hypothetical protein AAGC67_00705 [Myxococcota bacterium]
MTPSDTLLSLAEIAVALAGFTGIVGALGQRADDADRAIGWVRLRTMLEVSLRNAAFALLPLPFLGFADDPTLVWRSASGAYLSTVLAYLVFRRTRSSSPTESLGLEAPFLALLPFSLLACVANVFGLAGPEAFSLYLFSLVLGLVTAGLLFLSVAAMLFRPDPD